MIYREIFSENKPELCLSSGSFLELLGLVQKTPFHIPPLVPVVLVEGPFPWCPGALSFSGIRRKKNMVQLVPSQYISVHFHPGPVFMQIINMSQSPWYYVKMEILILRAYLNGKFADFSFIFPLFYKEIGANSPVGLRKSQIFFKIFSFSVSS